MSTDHVAFAERTVPALEPYRVAKGTWLIPHLAPAGPGVFLPVNSMVILGQEPMVVDTGTPIHHGRYAES